MEHARLVKAVVVAVGVEIHVVALKQAGDRVRVARRSNVVELERAAARQPGWGRGSRQRPLGAWRLIPRWPR